MLEGINHILHGRDIYMGIYLVWNAVMYSIVYYKNNSTPSSSVGLVGSLKPCQIKLDRYVEYIYIFIYELYVHRKWVAENIL